MGIRGLTSLINKYVPSAVKTRSLNYFKGSVIAIDTSILLYKFKYSNSNPNAHINGFLNKCMTYIKNGIIPVFIIDGKPPPEKNNLLSKRYRHKQKLIHRILELEEKIKLGEADLKYKLLKLKKQLTCVKKEHHLEASELLSSLGFKVINSEGEAEGLCAKLQKENVVNFTYSDDTDVFPLGCKKVLRSSINLNYLTEIELDDILEGLRLNTGEFVDMCILCGCDYCTFLPKINYEMAYELILKYKSIENIKKHTDYIPSGFNYECARKIFNGDSSRVTDSRVTDSRAISIDESRFTNFMIHKGYNLRFIQSYIRNFKMITFVNS